MRKTKKITLPLWMTIISVIYSLPAFPSFSEYSQFYSHYKMGKCDDTNSDAKTINSERMIKTAINYAKEWCKHYDGVKLGADIQDYNTETEGNNPYFCRVSGAIECKK